MPTQDETRTTTITHTSLLEDIQDHRNFALEQVVRVMNKTQYRMHRTFTESYGVETTHTTFQDTSLDTSVLITVTGFKDTVCQCVLFGKGVYSSPDVWETLAYGTPTSDERQIVFVVVPEYLQVPHTRGMHNQMCERASHCPSTGL